MTNFRKISLALSYMRQVVRFLESNGVKPYEYSNLNEAINLVEDFSYFSHLSSNELKSLLSSR